MAQIKMPPQLFHSPDMLPHIADIRQGFCFHRQGAVVVFQEHVYLRVDIVFLVPIRALEEACPH
ncbi:MAG: hypothetical protein LBU16_05520 [Treponema sp.]|jgi:hypothetical protein|nr:hypothetical protein [Treponema sp.]